MRGYDGGRHESRLTFRRVSWPGYAEGAPIEQFTGAGSYEWSAFSTLREAGSLSFAGSEIPDDHDMVRCYYSFVDDAGDPHEDVLFTAKMTCSEPTYEGDLVSGTAELSGLLQVLANKRYPQPFVVAKGRGAVELAKSLAEGCGLKVQAAPSSYTVSATKRFEQSDSYLTIVNWLLAQAGFAGAYTDAFGTVQMQPYVNPAAAPAVHTFGPDVPICPSIALSSDWANTPNCCGLVYEDEEHTIWAWAKNTDPLSRASTVSRAEENWMSETVSELSGSTVQAKVENLESQAQSKLLENSSDIEYAEVTHPWIPLKTNDAVAIEDSVEWKGAVTNITLTFSAAMQCKTKARRYIHPTLQIETSGGAI